MIFRVSLLCQFDHLPYHILDFAVLLEPCELVRLSHSDRVAIRCAFGKFTSQSLDTGVGCTGISDCSLQSVETYRLAISSTVGCIAGTPHSP